ncbi:MAG: hypothetical protein E6G77_23250 [Alphaproteobacteria bacterium]|nr:MAG: hypothetical protein E6G77_23250 [Alphaproteobacteria bacterium]
MNGSDDLGDRAEQLRRIELSKRRCALDQGNLGPPHPREIELGLRGLSRALEDNGIIGVAGDFADELVQLFSNCRA